MRLTYYYLVFEEFAEECPGEVWEGVLSCLHVVFSAYGYSEESEDLHDLHVICEDDAEQSLYNRLPEILKIKICKRQDIKTDIKEFLKKLIPVLKDDDDLCIVDNTNVLLDLDDLDDDD